MKKFSILLGLAMFMQVTSALSLDACDRSSLNLLSVTPNGNTWDITMELNIGAGVTGTVTGADNSTYTFSFGFFTGCSGPTSFTVNSFSPAVLVSDFTNCSYPGFLAGMAFGAQENVVYQNPSSCPFACVSNTNQCGNVYTQTDTITVNVTAVPDSIRVFGIEGVGNPLGGCYPNADMMIDLSNHPSIPSCSVDVQPPVLVCPASQVLPFNPANCLGFAPDLVSQTSATDCCTNPVLSQSPVAGTQIPQNSQVTVYATDSAGNTDSCVVSVQFVDTIGPQVNCSPVSLYLNGQGFASLSPNGLGSATDACGIASLSVSPNLFGCNTLGTNSASLTAVDVSGNIDSCSAIVTILDTIPPVPTCLDITVYLDSAGLFFIDPMSLNVGVSENCAVFNLSVNPPVLDTSNLGSNVVLLTATDLSGNVGSCQSNVFVADTFAVGVEERIPYGWEIFPNPVRDLLYLKTCSPVSEPFRIELLDMNGRILKTEVVVSPDSGSNWVIDCENLSGGIYYIKVVGNNWFWSHRALKW